MLRVVDISAYPSILLIYAMFVPDDSCRDAEVCLKAWKTIL